MLVRKANAAEWDAWSYQQHTDCIHRADNVTVLSHPASLLHQISSATGCLGQIILNWKLMHKFESYANVHVKVEQHKTNCTLSPVCKQHNHMWLLCCRLLWNCATWTVTATATFIPAHTMAVHVGGGDTIPLILNLACRERCLVRSQSHPGPHLTLWQYPVPQNNKLSSPKQRWIL
jgi:hypothetical protein